MSPYVNKTGEQITNYDTQMHASLIFNASSRYNIELTNGNECIRSHSSQYFTTTHYRYAMGTYQIIPVAVTLAGGGWSNHSWGNMDWF